SCKSPVTGDVGELRAGRRLQGSLQGNDADARQAAEGPVPGRRGLAHEGVLGCFQPRLCSSRGAELRQS
ncbi:unnamed protein product, partial [Effrenium voratum]